MTGCEWHAYQWLRKTLARRRGQEPTPSGEHEACGLPAGVGWAGYDCELPKGHTSKKHGFRSDHGWISWEQ